MLLDRLGLGTTLHQLHAATRQVARCLRSAQTLGQVDLDALNEVSGDLLVHERTLLLGGALLDAALDRVLELILGLHADAGQQVLELRRHDAIGAARVMMYRAKATGQSAPAVFDTNVRAQSIARLRLEIDLREWITFAHAGEDDGLVFVDAPLREGMSHD